VGATYAGILGPLAFGTVVARGLAHGSAPEGTLWLATQCLAVFGTLGYLIGALAGWIVWDAVRSGIMADAARAAAAGTDRESPA
jgi:hypothetical protein